MLSPDDELEAKRLIVAAKYQCAFIRWLQQHGWVCDSKCPIRLKVLKSIQEILLDEYHKKMKDEFPDES